MIRGIQQDGGLIAMAGDSIADMMALKSADFKRSNHIGIFNTR